MLTKNRIKYINTLKFPKYRKLSKQFIAEGAKTINELLESSFTIDSIYASREWISDNSNLLQLRDIEYTVVSPVELLRISALTNNEDVLAVVNIPDKTPDVASLFSDLLFFFDNISDPGNMGTIIRTADWFGVKNIVCSQGSVDVFNPKTVQSTMGSILRVNVFSLDLDELLKHKPNDIEIFGTTTDGENIFSTQLPAKALIVFGNESQGISKEVKHIIQKSISIPRYNKESNKPESLNVAVSFALVCSEFRKVAGY